MVNERRNKMEKELVNFLNEKYPNCEYELLNNDGRTFVVKVTATVDEILRIVINKRRGNNGNYREISCGEYMN